MDDAETLMKGTVQELDRLLNARNVLSDPIQHNGATIIPMISYGFGFGAGGGADRKSGNGAGAGCGGGIKPIGAIIIDQNGARVEAIKGAASSLAEAIGDVAGKVAQNANKGESTA